jgi:Na+/proline symporter/signal transduction histidine kinase
MIGAWLILFVSVAYLGLLFGIAYWGDRRADQGRSVIANPYIYALSLAVYCTAWTFYGSVGQAASTGIGFLPIYLGPTLMAALWWTVLRKMIRISKRYHITSIADFVSSRYGKSMLLGGLATVIAVVGVVPYISLQLKAVSTSYLILMAEPGATLARPGTAPLLQDEVFYVALLMALFAILFGTRSIDATEHHQGMVLAIAFESIVKLVAFLAVGAFVTFGLYRGFGDLFAQAAAVPEAARLFVAEGNLPPVEWAALVMLSMAAIVFLPRQFQVAVVENVDERHLNKAIWLLPLYLLLINIFVLPIAFAGLLRFPAGAVDPDTFVLTLPLAEGWRTLALFAFVGGLSAATGMIIVETIALSTMVSNDLVMPVLLRARALRLSERTDLTGLLLAIRRVAIVVVLLLGYAYFRVIGAAYTLVSIGLVSFAAVAQFAPVILGGMYWRGATRSGALAGLAAGFAVWMYTLPLPFLIEAGWLPYTILADGPFGIAALRPHALFGLAGWDPITHALFWSMVANAGLFVGVSLLGRQSVLEYSQAALFVDVFQPAERDREPRLWKGTTSVGEVQALLARFLGPERADEVLRSHARERRVPVSPDAAADPELVSHAERLLAGTVGSASARVLVASVVDEEPVGLQEVIHILDETSRVIAYSRELETKSLALEAATRELKAANARLHELDQLKDDFIATVTHELRTPLTSIRSFSEILYDNPDLQPEQRREYLEIIIKENQRLTRLINQVLELEKLGSERADWEIGAVEVADVVDEAAFATAGLFDERGIRLDIRMPPELPRVRADRDRLMQVVLNLLSNAAKFTPATAGRVEVRAERDDDVVRVHVQDNGPGVRAEHRELIFEKFAQAERAGDAGRRGTGLGLPISRRIVERLGGRIWVDDAPDGGAVFSFTVPIEPEPITTPADSLHNA